MAYPTLKGNEVAFHLVRLLQLGLLPICKQDQILTRMIAVVSD